VKIFSKERNIMAQTKSAGQGTIDDLCINTMRTLAIDAIEAAKSGHP
jgi:hypothetical protein